MMNTIKDMRIARGLTMREVADAVGVSEATVSRWESGNIGNMRRDRIASLAKILGVSPLDIIGQQEIKGVKAQLIDYIDGLSDEECEAFLLLLKKKL